MNHLATVTIGDFVGPETLAILGDIDHLSDTPEFLSEEQAYFMMHGDMGQTRAWHQLWLFGIVVDDDLNWYVPDDYDTVVSWVSLDQPSAGEEAA